MMGCARRPTPTQWPRAPRRPPCAICARRCDPVVADEDHADAGHSIGNGGDEAVHQEVLDTEIPDDLRQPEGHAVDAGEQREVGESQQPDVHVLDGRLNLCPTQQQACAGSPLPARRPLAIFVRRQPFRLSRAIIEIEIAHDPEDDRRRTFEQEQPLPTVQAIEAVERFMIQPDSGPPMTPDSAMPRMKMAQIWDRNRAGYQ